MGLVIGMEPPFKVLAELSFFAGFKGFFAMGDLLKNWVPDRAVVEGSTRRAKQRIRSTATAQLGMEALSGSRRGPGGEGDGEELPSRGDFAPCRLDQKAGGRRARWRRGEGRTKRHERLPHARGCEPEFLLYTRGGAVRENDAVWEAIWGAITIRGGRMGLRAVRTR